MKIFLLSSLVFLLWAISCNKEKETQGLTIVYGSVCGWCGGEDSVILTESRVNYRNIQACDHHAYTKICATDKEGWDNLTDIVDFDEFEKIHLNTCNVCVDGCDQWISIRDGSRFHKIRFGSQDSVALLPIKVLVYQLDSIIRIYRPVAEM